MPPTAEHETGQALLRDRGVISVTGREGIKLLQGILTNDLTPLETGAAVFAALLTPQGKILADLIVAPQPGGVLIDVSRSVAADITKRLAMYKLRADVAIADASDNHRVIATWGKAEPLAWLPADAVTFQDPRDMRLGRRTILNAENAEDVSMLESKIPGDAGTYDALRVSLGVCEGGIDYNFADVYPHEANFDVLHGVSFTKGCYVGQEIVARMQNKTVVRRRVVKIKADGDIKPGDDVLFGEVPIGRIGTVAGTDALALLRLDRAIEAHEKGIALRAGSVAVTPDPAALATYAKLAAQRAASASAR